MGAAVGAPDLLADAGCALAAVLVCADGAQQGSHRGRWRRRVARWVAAVSVGTMRAVAFSVDRHTGAFSRRPGSCRAGRSVLEATVGQGHPNAYVRSCLLRRQRVSDCHFLDTRFDGVGAALQRLETLGRQLRMGPGQLRDGAGPAVSDCGHLVGERSWRWRPGRHGRDRQPWTERRSALVAGPLPAGPSV